MSHILLTYVYADTHKHAYDNLKYFIETAVRKNDGVDYIFILQQVHGKEVDEKEMPSVPKGNAFYIQHENKCYDFGTIGWFLEKYTIDYSPKNSTSVMNGSDSYRKFNLTQYKYFIFMNSSTRGPFFPPYFLKFLEDYQKKMNEAFHWYDVFTRRINAKVKLVGCTINCVPLPHAQSYFLITDFIGFSVLLKDSFGNGQSRAGVFGCYRAQGDTISISEIGISHQILGSGYMIDCLLTKSRPIEFLKNRNYDCIVPENPFTDKHMDGTSLDPYEVVFVKFNDKKYTLDAQNKAKLYQRWAEDRNVQNRSSW